MKKYGKQIADHIYRAGIPKSFIDTACRFYTEDGVPIETLQDDFKKWNRYVLNNPSYAAKVNKNLNVYKSYLDFKKELQKAMTPFICPNPIYDDGNLSIGELKTQRDARWFPIQNLAFPDDNNDYCVSKKDGGFQQFQKYRQLGYKMLIIYDKSKSVNDEFKRAFVIARNGHLDFWNNYDTPCGTTKKKNDPIWKYINSLPHEAQIALSEFAESTLSERNITESKTNNNMKKNVVKLNENTLRQIVAESVKKVLNEIGNTEQGLGAVAQNVDRRATQTGTVYNNGNSTVPQKMDAMGKEVNAQQYLAQAIQNAIANGMSEQQIEAVLKQNMSQNFNPTYGNGTLTWNRR